MPAPNNKYKAQIEAAAQAVKALKDVNLPERCALLGLERPHPDGSLNLRVFGQNLIFKPPDFQAVVADTGQHARLADEILVLHYLLNTEPVVPTGELITFRDFPGGQFYYQPFLARTAIPLVGQIGNNIELLRSCLGRFDFEPVDMGDLGARIHALGRIEITLVYHTGNEEFAPSVQVLFDACTKNVYCTEDAAALAGRVCRGLLGEDCQKCTGCGICITRN